MINMYVMYDLLLIVLKLEYVKCLGQSPQGCPNQPRYQHGEIILIPDHQYQ